MLKLSKKQVKGITNILKSKNSTHRPALQVVTIDKYKAFISDGFCLVELSLEKEYPELEVHHEILTRWYKLAGPKDILTEDDLINMSRKPEIAPINFNRLIDGADETRPTKVLSLNAKILNNLVTVLGDERIRLDFTGPNSVLKVSPVEPNGIRGYLMPIRTK